MQHFISPQEFEEIEALLKEEVPDDLRWYHHREALRGLERVLPALREAYEVIDDMSGHLKNAVDANRKVTRFLELAEEATTHDRGHPPPTGRLS